MLHLWLVDVPDYAAFIHYIDNDRCIVWNTFWDSFMTSLSATGWIRNYQIVVSCIILCIFPIGYIALKFGCSASSVFYISIFFTLIAGFVRFSVLSESDWLFIEETYKGCFISCSRSDGSFFAVACFHKISFPFEAQTLGTSFHYV